MPAKRVTSEVKKSLTKLGQNDINCEHTFRALWNDYYSSAGECTKCGYSEVKEY